MAGHGLILRQHGATGSSMLFVYGFRDYVLPYLVDPAKWGQNSRFNGICILEVALFIFLKKAKAG